jgi:hypothetical protein
MEEAMPQAIYEVVAGIIPNTIDPEYTRRYASGRGDDFNLQDMLKAWHDAVAYALYLQLLCAEGRAVNWVRIDFLWP